MDELQPIRKVPPQSRRRSHRMSMRPGQAEGVGSLPMLLTVDDAAELLRTTCRAIYAMVERRQLPGIIRIGRRVLLRRDDLLDWINQKRAPSLKE